MTALRRWWSRADQRITDGALGMGFALAATIELIANKHHTGPLGADIAASFVLFSTYAWRRRAPLAAALAFVAIAILMSGWLARPDQITADFLGVIVAAYSAAAHSSLRSAAIALVGVAIGVVGVDALGHKLDSGDIAFPIAFCVLGWLAGRAVRARTRLARELAETALRLEHEREFHAALAARDERGRIARELHDVVAHSMTVMVIQAGAARRVLADPDRSAQALETVERVGREALEELRRLLGVLGDSEEPIELAPQPGLDDLEALVGRARDAGLQVDLRVEGEAAALPSGVDLAAYRVVQEALTNTIKHSGGASAHVLVRYGDAELELTIADDGSGPAAATHAAGHGLVGMRERVALYGGEVEAGPRAGGGFEVRARIPVAEKAVAA